MNKRLLIKAMQQQKIRCEMIGETLWTVNGHDVFFSGNLVEIENVRGRFTNAESLLWILKNSEILDISKIHISKILYTYRELIY